MIFLVRNLQPQNPLNHLWPHLDAKLVGARPVTIGRWPDHLHLQVRQYGKQETVEIHCKYLQVLVNPFFSEII